MPSSQCTAFFVTLLEEREFQNMAHIKSQNQTHMGSCVSTSAKEGATQRVRLRRLHAKKHGAHPLGRLFFPQSTSRHFVRFRLRQLPHEVSCFVAPQTGLSRWRQPPSDTDPMCGFQVLGFLVNAAFSQHGSVCRGRIGLSFTCPPQGISLSHVNGNWDQRKRIFLASASIRFSSKAGLWTFVSLYLDGVELDTSPGFCKHAPSPCGPARFLKRPVWGHAALWRPN